MKYFIENRISSYMLFAGLFVFGLIGLGKLSVSLMPQTNYPAISVIIEYPGISPEKIENLITKPVEKIVKTVSGIESINSISEEGKSRININFKLNIDVKIAALKVREKIGLIKSYFPREVQEPVVVRYDPSDRPVIIATIAQKGKTVIEVREIAERTIKQKLQRIEGISEINIAGGMEREIHINLDYNKFSSRNLSFNEISKVIQGSNISLPGGKVFWGNKNYTIYTSERYRDISEISKTIIFSSDKGAQVSVYDIADVKDAFKEREDIARLNGKENVTLYIHRAGDANTLSVCNEAERILKDDPNIDVKMIYNQGKFVSAAVGNVFTSSIWGIAIVTILLSLFIRKGGMVFAIGISIPMSLFIVFALMYFFKIDLNVMSLSGLALGVGMVVDNGIVIAESIHSNGEITGESILKSLFSVKNAIISSTFTTIIVFFPIVFGNPSVRNSYGDLSFTISFALMVSLFSALFFLPAVIYGTSKFNTGFGLENSMFLKLNKGFNSIQIKFKEGEDYLLNSYRAILDYSFKNRKKVIRNIAIISISAFVMFFFIRSEYIDPSVEREFYLYLEFPTGTSLKYTDKAVIEVEKYLKDLNVSEKISTKVEKWRGTLTVKFKEKDLSQKEASDIKQKIRNGCGKILKKYNGFPFITEANEIAARELNIIFTGNNIKKLQNIAKRASREISSISSIEECILRFREGRPEYQIKIDKEKAALFDLSSSEIAEFFRNGLYGPVTTKFIDKDREVDVRMRFLPRQRDSIDKIMNYRMRSRTGSTVPLSEVVTVEEQRGPGKIWRKNGKRSATITAKLGKTSYEEAVKKIDRVIKKRIKFPEEYSYGYDENLKKIRDNKREMLISIGLAVVLVYMILASLFESFLIPVIIMTTLPLALTGVVITLFITFSTFNISVYIGLIVLAGIVVNNAIILVNTINNEYQSSKINKDNLIDIIKEACYKRFKPVLITTLTTVFGMVPMLIKSGEGSNLWRPLSLTVISGLIFSTLLTLIVVPLYSYSIYNFKLQRESLR